MAPVGQVLERKIFPETKMCKFYPQGKCTNGVQCPWAHDAAELNAAPNLRRTSLCNELTNEGNGTRGRTLPRSAEDVTDEVLNYLMQARPTAAMKKSAGKSSNAERTSTMEIPDYVPAWWSADAQDFIPMDFSAQLPALVPMLLPPLGVGNYTPYGSTCGYTSFPQEESESDGRSNGDIKIDGNTPIAEILALSFTPKRMSFHQQACASKYTPASNAASLENPGCSHRNA